MPSCRPDVIPAIVYKAMEFKPRTILDIGAGRGKWGCLLDEYIRYWCGYEPSIDCMEAYMAYESPAYRFYHNVFPFDVTKHLNFVRDYDLVLLIDVIEHIEKTQGKALLNEVSNHYIVSTPAYWNPQAEMFGNPYERHISHWKPEDFENYELVIGRNRSSHIVAWK